MAASIHPILSSLLQYTAKERASDLHLSSGHPPVLRISGRLIPLAKEEVLTGESIQAMLFSVLSQAQQKTLNEQREVDFSYVIADGSRFRINTYFERDQLASAFRLIPPKIAGIDDLNLPPVLHEFSKATQGFVLVTGPSGHGKSTTLAAIIDEINHTRAEHIVTIEDPIEYVFSDDQALIDQREVGKDASSFASALRATFRQDPDVIMVGEMRDPETISTAITAAETGHLVFATLHTNSAAQSIHRVVDSFPPAQQVQIRAQLSGSLLGVISQRLLPRTSGGLIPACEVLFSTPAVANLIRENKIHEIPLVIETSAEKGMISLNKSLANLSRSREVTLENAMKYSLNPLGLRSLL